MLVPVASPALASPDLMKSGPYLGYSAESGMGRILSAAWDETGRHPPPGPAFSSHLATVLATMARDGRGLAWSPLSLVGEDIAAGRLVKVGQPSDEVPIAINLFRPRARQSQAAEHFWQRIRDQALQDEKNANSSSSTASGRSS